MLDRPTKPPDQSLGSNGPGKVPSAPPSPAPTESARPRKTKPSRSRWIWLTLAVLILLGLSAYFFRGRITGAQSGGAASKTAAKGPSPIPVVAATARQGDIGVY